jgi:hypothetical protein
VDLREADFDPKPEVESCLAVVVGERVRWDGHSQLESLPPPLLGPHLVVTDQKQSEDVREEPTTDVALAQAGKSWSLAQQDTMSAVHIVLGWCWRMSEGKCLARWALSVSASRLDAGSRNWRLAEAQV